MVDACLQHDEDARPSSAIVEAKLRVWRREAGAGAHCELLAFMDLAPPEGQGTDHNEHPNERRATSSCFGFMRGLFPNLQRVLASNALYH